MPCRRTPLVASSGHTPVRHLGGLSTAGEVAHSSEPIAAVQESRSDSLYISR